MVAEEHKVITLKYQSPQFGKIDPSEIIKTAWGLLIKLHVITGWTIPQDELIQNELVKQFSLKLTESYSNVNSDEMEYAFRNNSDVKDWGKAMNLNLIDEVMQPYLSKRIELSRMEEQIKTKKELPAPNFSVTDQEFIDGVYALYQHTKAQGANNAFKCIPVLAYDVLEPVLALKKEDKTTIKEYVEKRFALPENELKDMCKMYAVSLYFEKL